MILRAGGFEELTPTRRVLLRLRSLLIPSSRLSATLPGVVFVVGLSVGLAAVAVIYVLLIALARAAANRDRMDEEWLARLRKDHGEQA